MDEPARYAALAAKYAAAVAQVRSLLGPGWDASRDSDCWTLNGRAGAPVAYTWYHMILVQPQEPGLDEYWELYGRADRSPASGEGWAAVWVKDGAAEVEYRVADLLGALHVAGLLREEHSK